MRRIILNLILSAAMLFPATLWASSLDELNLITEFYPPYNYEEDGQIKGISVDILLRVLEKTGSSLSRSDIELMQWSKGYDLALNSPGTLLFATTRTEDREDLFKWAGPISPTKISLVAKKGSWVGIDNLGDIAAKDYKIGVVKDDVAHQILKKRGVPESCLEIRAFPGLNFMELYKGEIDAWAYEENVAMWISGVYGFDSSGFDPVYTLQKGELFYAFHKDTPDSAVKALQEALDQVRAEGGFKQVMEKYR
jgi:ABC-type amino acid transport substrate-binding protein